MRQKSTEKQAVRGFVTIGALYSYLYCMLASNVLLSLPILGGALYLTGKIGLMLGSLRRPAREGMISKPLRRWGTALLLLMLLALFSLITVYPIQIESAMFWHLAGIVFCTVLRPAVTQYVVERALIARKKAIHILWRVLAVQLAFLPPLLLMLLLSSLSRGTVWALLGGYLVSGILEAFPLSRLNERMDGFTPEDQAEIQALRQAHAYKMFQNMMLVVTAALQVTQVMSFTYIAFTADALIVCMGIALLCTYGASLVSDAVLKRGIARKADPNFFMMFGLVIWLYGLVLFARSLDAPGSVSGYLSLALCTAGATVCLRMLVYMEDDMRRVAAFAMGHEPSDAVDAMQRIRVDASALTGQLIALAGLTLLSIFTATDFPSDWGEAFRSFSPLLILPALLLVGLAILFALRFPLTQQHLEKLRRYMALQNDGRQNAPLHDQLEAVVVQKSLKRYGIKAILLILRPLYYHKIRGRENIKLDEDTPCVFVCNHGEIYGPVVSTLYVPYSFRPWVAYEMTDVNAIASRTMEGTFQNVRVFWRKPLNFLMVKVGAPFLAWIMKSVDCIPVYHDNPRKLMQTFRETTAAMEAGDNILLFPENADTSSDHRYVRQGVSEFFTGFTMIGQLYNNRTGKCPLFVPLYADKHKRTITFGVPTRYNPEINANEEKERLCAYLRSEMLRVAGLEEESARK